MYKSNSINLDDKLTKQLVGRIYAETDLSKFRYEMLNYENDLQKILKNKYFVSINFFGTNCLLVFTKVLDKFYSFTVDRQTLSYNFSKVDFSKVKLNLVNIHLDDNIYNGTIFEGILVKRYNMDDVYIISDVYKFCGKDMTKEKLNIKFLNIVGYLKWYWQWLKIAYALPKFIRDKCYRFIAQNRKRVTVKSCDISSANLNRFLG